MLRDPRTPLISKPIAVAAFAYLVSPVDLVSDLIPMLGWMDDGVAVTVLLWLAYRLLPADLHVTLRRRAAPAPRPSRDGEIRRSA